jgi:hypothetical protein
MNTPKAMRVNDEMIEKALRATGGFMSLAAQRLGCSYRTVLRRMNASPRLQQSMAEICDKKLDITEAGWAICFYLKCKGKQRGYVERQEVTGKDGAPIVALDAKVPETELDKIINGD